MPRWRFNGKGRIDSTVEGRLRDQDQGIYRGYPMLTHDPITKNVLKMWRDREDRVPD